MREDETVVAEEIRSHFDEHNGAGEETEGLLESESGFILKLEDGTKYLVMVTKNGVIKKTELDEFKDVRRSGLIAIKIKPDDNLEWVKPSGGADDIMLVTAQGQSIRFSEKDVRAMGRAASGVFDRGHIEPGEPDSAPRVGHRYLAGRK